MDAQKIKIELELLPETALFLGMYVAITTKGDFTMHNMLSDKSIATMHDIAQNIIDQIQEKTDAENLRMRNRLNAIEYLNEQDWPNNLRDILN